MATSSVSTGGTLPPPVPGAVRPGELYRADEAASRVGWRPAGFRAAQRNGLKVFRRGRRVYVRGVDLIAYLTSQPEEVARG